MRAIAGVLDDHRNYRDTSREFGVDHKTVRRWVSQSSSVSHYAGGCDGDFKLRVLRVAQKKAYLCSRRPRHSASVRRARSLSGSASTQREVQRDCTSLSREVVHGNALLKKERTLVEERIARESGRRPTTATQNIYSPCDREYYRAYSMSSKISSLAVKWPKLSIDNSTGQHISVSGMQILIKISTCVLS